MIKLNEECKYIESTMLSYELTKYPNIYKKTSWGNYIHNESESDVISNRNQFVEDFNIRSYSKCRAISDFINKGKNSTVYFRFFDHCEAYKMNDGRFILIVSPYSDSIKDLGLCEDFKEKFGFEEIYKLYHPQATTMVKIVYNLKQLKLYL